MAHLPVHLPMPWGWMPSSLLLHYLDTETDGGPCSRAPLHHRTCLRMAHSAAGAAAGPEPPARSAAALVGPPEALIGERDPTPRSSDSTEAATQCIGQWLTTTGGACCCRSSRRVDCYPDMLTLQRCCKSWAVLPPQLAPCTCHSHSSTTEQILEGTSYRPMWALPFPLCPLQFLCHSSCLPNRQCLCHSIASAIGVKSAAVAAVPLSKHHGVRGSALANTHKPTLLYQVINGFVV